MSKNSSKSRYNEIRDLIEKSGMKNESNSNSKLNLIGLTPNTTQNRTQQSIGTASFHEEPLMRITKLKSKEPKAYDVRKITPLSSNLTDVYFPNNRTTSQPISRKPSSRGDQISFQRDPPPQKENPPPLPNFGEPELITESNFEIMRSEPDEEMELAAKLKPTKVCTVPTDQGISFDLVHTEAEAEKIKKNNVARAYLSTASTKPTFNSPKRTQIDEDSDLEDILARRSFFIKKSTDASAHLKNYASSGLRVLTTESDQRTNSPFKKPQEFKIKTNPMSKSSNNFRQGSLKNLHDKSKSTTPVSRPFTAADSNLMTSAPRIRSIKSKPSSISSKDLKPQRSLSNLEEISKETSGKPTLNELLERDNNSPVPEKELPVIELLSPKSYLPPIIEENDNGLLPPDAEDNIIQKAIVKGPPLNMIEAFPEETAEILGTIQSIEDKLAAKQQLLNAPKEDNFDATRLKRTDMLSEHDIMIIRAEYEKKRKRNVVPNWELVDKLVHNLKFFSKLSKPVRVSLLRESEYFFMASGKTVFKQGDFGDLMYIILRGSVNVLQWKKTFYGEMINQTIAVLYDGNHFGELAMLGTAAKNPRKTIATVAESKNLDNDNAPKTTTFENRLEQAANNNASTLANLDLQPPKKEEYNERSKRAATIVVSESADFLALPRDKFKAVFLDLIQKELDTKLNVLMSMHFFDKIDPISLISLANNINVRTYRMGELILGTGDEIDRLRIIAGGKCRVVLAIVKSSEVEANPGRSSLIKPLKNLNFHPVDYTCASTMRVKEEPVIKMPKIKSMNRAFDFEPLGDDENDTRYIQHITFSILGKSDFFGGRGIFTKEEYLAVDEEGTTPQTYYGPAKLNVVADSYMVEIYEIERDRIAFVHEYVRRLLKKGLKEAKDFDDLDVAEEIEKIENWEDMKKWTMHHNLKPKNAHGDTFKKY